MAANTVTGQAHAEMEVQVFFPYFLSFDNVCRKCFASIKSVVNTLMLH